MVVVVVFVVVFIILCQRNLRLKFVQNWVNNKQCIVVVVVVVTVLFLVGEPELNI